MTTTNALTVNHLILEVADALSAKAKTEKYEIILTLVTASLITLALVTALQPLIKSAFSGVIHYDTAMIATISVAGGLGLICILVCLQRRCMANQIEIPVEPENGEIVQKFTAAYNPHFGMQESFTLSLNTENGLRRNSIISRSRNEYKNLVLRVYRDYYDLQTQQCRDPSLVEDLRQHRECAAVRDELDRHIAPGFLQLLS